MLHILLHVTVVHPFLSLTIFAKKCILLASSFAKLSRRLFSHLDQLRVSNLISTLEDLIVDLGIEMGVSGN